MAKTKSLADLFVNLLKDMYYAEKQIMKTLPKLAKHADSAELRKTFEHHLKETEGQVQRLEQVFALNEELDEVREMRVSGAPPEQWQARLARARGPIEARRESHAAELQTLSDEWDTLIDREAAADERRPVLAALRERMLERNYINNLLAGIERELVG